MCEGVHQRGLDGPAADGPAWVERKRDSRGCEEGSEDGEGAGKGVQAGVAAAHVEGADGVPRGEGQRRDGGAVLCPGDEVVLQGIEAERRGDEQGAVKDADALHAAQVVAEHGVQAGVVVEGRRVGIVDAVAGVEPDDEGVEDEVVDEEGLHREVVAVLVVAAAPGAGDEGGADEADEVERAPGFVAGDEGDAAVEQGKVAEKADVVVAAAGGEDGRGEAADQGDLREDEGVLHHGEGDEQAGGRHHEDEGEGRRDEAVQFEGGEGGEVEDGERCALYGEGVVAAFVAQAPADKAEDDGGRGDGAVAQRDGDVDARRGVAQEEGEAEEEDGDAGFQQQVFTEPGGEGVGFVGDVVVVSRGSRTGSRFAVVDGGLCGAVVSGSFWGRIVCGSGFVLRFGRRRGRSGGHVRQVVCPDAVGFFVGRGRWWGGFRRRQWCMDVAADVVQRHGACCGRLRGETGEAHFYRAHVALQGGNLLLQRGEFATQGGFVSAVPGVLFVAIAVVRTGLLGCTGTVLGIIVVAIAVVRAGLVGCAGTVVLLRLIAARDEPAEAENQAEDGQHPFSTESKIQGNARRQDEGEIDKGSGTTVHISGSGRG